MSTPQTPDAQAVLEQVRASASDYVKVGELCLLGKFREIPECLFLRRLHDRSSSQHARESAGWSCTGRDARDRSPRPVEPLPSSLQDHRAVHAAMADEAFSRRPPPEDDELAADRLRREIIQALVSRFPRLGGSAKQTG
jgi:hypothetical protein